MTSKSELKRRATVNPIGTAAKFHDIEKQRDVLLQALSNLVDDCEIWKLSMSEVLSTEEIGWDSLDVAKELVKPTKKKGK